MGLQSECFLSKSGETCPPVKAFINIHFPGGRENVERSNKRCFLCN